MSPVTHRLSLVAAVLVGVLALPRVEDAASRLDGRFAFAVRAERIEVVRAALTEALATARVAATRARAHRNAAKPLAVPRPHRGNPGIAETVHIFNINA
jgi:hypothetical protein